MKSHTLSIKSWHFWLANFGNDRVHRDEGVDVCSYIRKVLVGFLVFLAAAIGTAIVVSLLLAVIVGTGYWWYQMIVAGGLVEPNSPGVIGTIGILMFGYIRLHRYINRKLDVRKPSPPGFVGLVFTKFKSKTCFMINFNSKDSK